MGLFDFLKKKEQPKEKQDNRILLAMPMFADGQKYEIDSVVDNLKSYWNLNVTEVEGDSNAAVLTIDSESVAIAYMPAPIPTGDIEGTAQYAYNWLTVLEDLKDATGHSIVSVMRGTKSPLERHKLLTKVLYSILVTSDSIGVYQGTQSLLIPKNQYIESAQELKEEELPITLWIYLGLRQSDTGNSIYTYGLTAFDKNEIEVINSKLGLEELFNFIANICSYVVGSNVTLKDGETLGLTADQKIKIRLSPGQFVEGQSLKLEM